MTSADTTSLRFQKSVDVLREIDLACTSFERALQRGELLNINDLVAAASSDARVQLLRDLLTLEMEFRSKCGELPTIDQFRERFPQEGQLVKYLYLEYFLPSRIGDFSIHQLLGRGAFGHVYQGWDAKLARYVAIKFFRRDPMDPALRQGNLLAEARMVAQLQHPGIVTVYGIQPDEDGDEFLVLEYVDGKSLEDLLRSDRFTPYKSAQLLLAVIEALQAAHRHGLIHRDLKPANILLDSSRRPRVTDFGLAMHLATTHRRPELAGTLAYMAPEQAGGETHRLDARTDLWAVGVILYRLLTGRLPFSGNSQSELLEAIRYAEPLDICDVEPHIPAELARIVRRCLAKRMSDRYQSSAELADDISVFLHPRVTTPSAEGAKRYSDPAIVPKGLRCFDASDRDFFLSLVPGPRDRDGVPAAIRFWQRNLQEADSTATFRVALLYGPSGCGKSSLIRAGILPRLPQNVISIIVEAARDETEIALIRELRRRFPDLSTDLSLPELIREIREGPSLPPGGKVVVVFDQFEQWLHDWHQDSIAQLIESLRQCDGGRVQAVVLVRDDFWMQATRFFQRLDIPLIEHFNACAVDLFDRVHAKKVLAAFGVAYGQLDQNLWPTNQDQGRFLDRAVEELANDGWIVPVRLCIFAEMVKARPWCPATLQDVGGAEGLGEAFLEEMFEGRSASPMYRLHRKASRLVLERLLPPLGTDIRGHLVPELELRAVSGYEHRPADFDVLLRCLDKELRLITPTEINASESSAPTHAEDHKPALRLYQLTHDFLVTAIRGWLNQARRRSFRGRAELRLADYANAYSVRQETRQLPSWWEWLCMLGLTRARRWTVAESKMMRRATRHHAQRITLAIAAAILAVLIVYDRIAAVRADGLVAALATSDSDDLPQAADRLVNFRYWTKPRLVRRLALISQDQDERVRILVGLVALGDPKTDELMTRLLDSPPSMVVAIADVLLRHDQLESAESQLWSTANDDSRPPAKRLRAMATLTRLSPQERAERWHAIASTTESLLLSAAAEDPGQFSTWVDAFFPVREWLIGPLQQSLGDKESSEAERLLAANILGRYVADNASQLMELALQSGPKQFEVFVRALGKPTDVAKADLLKTANSIILEAASEDEKDLVARRQANSILMLCGSGDEEFLWPALRYSRDPRLRSFLLEQLQHGVIVPNQLLSHLSDSDPGIRQAVVLILGGGPSISASADQHSIVTESLADVYRRDPDSGVHSAAEWSLRRFGAGDLVGEILSDLAKQGVRPGYKWYVTKSLITMIIFERPGLVRLGSPESEPGRDSSDEATWTCDINWSFAVSATEITQKQYRDIWPKYEKYLNEHAPLANAPVNAVSWLDAVRFCRLLSERDGIPESEMVVPAVDDLRKTPYPDFISHSGYRLPVEAEWEVACRAGTTTPRFYGHAPDLLSQYVCYIANSGGHTRAVGIGIPNQAGLFDTLGNVAEWCYDRYDQHPELRQEQTNLARGFVMLANYSVRGNEYASDARVLRSANRRFGLFNEPNYSRGFRIAHSMRSIDGYDPKP